MIAAIAVRLRDAIAERAVVRCVVDDRPLRRADASVFAHSDDGVKWICPLHLRRLIAWVRR